MEKQIRVKEYLEYFRRHEYPALFDGTSNAYLDTVGQHYGEIETEEAILETFINTAEKNCDFSIKVLTGNECVKEYWLELDQTVDAELPPCRFIDASFLRPGLPEGEIDTFIDTEVKKLAGEERTLRLKGTLKTVVARLEGKCPGLYQLGAMDRRGQDDRMRVFTQTLKIPDALALLKALGWQGNAEKLESFLTEIETYAVRRGFIIDFDIFENGISDTVGINFDLSTYSRRYLEKWLEFLVEKGLCIPDKAEEIIKWTYAPPQPNPFIINDWSHFKFKFDHDVRTAKVYLRQGTRVSRTFDLYDGPSLMNLELTDRCPLHCPQCYCDLNHGYDLPLDTALYWIREAAKSHVQTVNLSGGETFVYPHIEQLIKECAVNGLDANIAISGWNATREKLQAAIDAGVYEICVSLNGSTEEINSLTRDGYSHALAALETLNSIGFPRTCINWVMHSNNADDFPEIVALAERLHVNSIAVMIFKPNAAHELPTIPSAEQMRTVAGFIKHYTGKIAIVPEPCFSQMRALVYGGFLFNSNLNVYRGCGAGRDGISVSLDGRLTPCRHLEFKEEYPSIYGYWNGSEILEKLRNVENHMEEPCADCRLNRNCLPCAAVNVKLRDRIAMGCKECRIVCNS